MLEVPGKLVDNIEHLCNVAIGGQVLLIDFDAGLSYLQVLLPSAYRKNMLIK